jgi:hypothetical protein
MGGDLKYRRERYRTIQKKDLNIKVSTGTFTLYFDSIIFVFILLLLYYCYFNLFIYYYFLESRKEKGGVYIYIYIGPMRPLGAAGKRHEEARGYTNSKCRGYGLYIYIYRSYISIQLIHRIL